MIVATVYATDDLRILKTIACWHHPLTPVCYLMFSACGGSVASLTMLALFSQPTPQILKEIALTFLLEHGLTNMPGGGLWTTGVSQQYRDSNRLRNDQKVRSLMPPHTSENYLQKEMGFVVARRHAIKLVYFNFFWSVAQSPALFLVDHPGILSMATIFHIIGIFVERWLFFAEAKHVVTLYYGDEQLSIAS